MYVTFGTVAQPTILKHMYKKQDEMEGMAVLHLLLFSIQMH